jgi:hypothetical protein
MGKVLVIKGADFSSVAVEQVQIIDPSTPMHNLSVVSSDTNMGTVTGGGIYAEDANVSISATPKNGYKFVRWNDGNTSATRSITIGDDDATYTATFAVDSNISNDNLFKVKSDSSGSLTRDMLVFGVLDASNCSISVSVASGAPLKAALQLYGRTAESIAEDLGHDESNPSKSPTNSLKDQGWITAGNSRTYNQATLSEYSGTSFFAFCVAITYAANNTGFPTLSEIEQYVTISTSGLNIMR